MDAGFITTKLKKMKFKDKKEFAEAILKHGTLYTENVKVSFDITKEVPFRYSSSGSKYNEPITGGWSAFNRDWSTEAPLKDMDIVIGVDEIGEFCISTVGFYNSVNKSLFSPGGKRNGAKYNRYILLKNPPQFLLDQQAKLKEKYKTQC